MSIDCNVRFRPEPEDVGSGLSALIKGRTHTKAALLAWGLLLGACDSSPQANSVAIHDDAPVIHDSPVPTGPGHELKSEPLTGKSLEGLIERSDTSFWGKVVSIDHRDSMDDSPVAHTFVTYRVIGNSFPEEAGSEVTLRFIGGIMSNGSYLWVSDIPKFKVGQEDLVFVKDNGLTACPLLGCSKGRIRVLEGHLYSDGGREILLDSGGIHYGRLRNMDAELSDGWSVVVSSPRPPSAADAMPWKAASMQDLLKILPPRNSMRPPTRSVSIRVDDAFAIDVQSPKLVSTED